MAGVRLVFTKAFMVTVLLTLLLNVGVRPAAGRGVTHLCSLRDPPAPGGACGGSLSDQIEWACVRHGRWQRPRSKKRDAERVAEEVPKEVPEEVPEEAPSAKRLTRNQPEQDDRLSKIRLSKKDAYLYSPSFPMPNVVCECCMNVCGIPELLTYC